MDENISIKRSFGEIRDDFSNRVIDWHTRNGRHDLPWQGAGDPYPVWVSEVMLQQTRVDTVIPYFHRFMACFPSIRALADASDDEVMRLWSGLGYYARARNLKRAAERIRDRHGGLFPQGFDDVVALPGIGRSTAGAILSLALGQVQPILDGNVKRVLARCFAVEGWPGSGATLRRLWQLAEGLTPAAKTGVYNQAMMDLGAMLCTRGDSPACGACPVADYCEALRSGRQADYPAPKPRRTLPVQERRLLMLIDGKGALLLERRPPSGIWGGLWSLPECDMAGDVGGWIESRFDARALSIEAMPARRHTFSHFHLDYVPVLCRVEAAARRVMDGKGRVWYNIGQDEIGGLASPVARLIEEYLGGE